MRSVAGTGGPRSACRTGPAPKARKRHTGVAVSRRVRPDGHYNRFTMTTKYDPKARFELNVFEEPFRKTAKGRQLMAKVYQPKGKGPFPVLLDLHGGAWNNKNRTANEPMARAIAASGVLVVSTDMTLAGEAPYPACVQDAHYAVRWLKMKAPGWNGHSTAAVAAAGAKPAVSGCQ